MNLRRPVLPVLPSGALGGGWVAEEDVEEDDEEDDEDDEDEEEDEKDDDDDEDEEEDEDERGGSLLSKNAATACTAGLRDMGSPLMRAFEVP